LFPASSPLITGPIPYIAATEALAASQDDAIPPELVSLREEIGTCDQKLAQYRVAVDSGADPAVGQWITEIQARKLAADARVRAATGTRPGPERMTKEQIAATVTAISELVQALRYATTEDARPRSTRALRPRRCTRYPPFCVCLSTAAGAQVRPTE
jgi:hypothetical protein